MPSLKKQLLSGHTTIGSWITLSNPAIAEIMARAGFDWLTIDLEHSIISVREAGELIRVADLCGTVPLVRLSSNDPVQIKRLMDAGAHGVIVPMVNSRYEAEKAVSAVKYPPKGKRGVGLARAQKYGTGFDAYKDWVEHESVVIVQIEHMAAIESIDSILETPGVDGTIIGPYDLSGSLGYPGEFDRPEVIKALALYEKACRKAGKAMGIHVVQPDPAAVNKYRQNGYTLIAVGVDFLYLGNKCRETLNNLKR